MAKSAETRPVIIGSGLAGLATALHLAELNCPSILVSRGSLGAMTSSAWAQGGIAAAVGADDSPASHAADTLQAGAGLCDPAIVRLVCEAAPEAITQLERWGVVFDRDVAGYKLGLEGAHSHRRILHIKGDGSGAGIVNALVARVHAEPLIEIRENSVLDELPEAPAIILSTGGAGALWHYTTNPLASWGQGLALARAAGAHMRDLEFMQFHPTALDVGIDPMPLLSEALRGEGATLVNSVGERILENDLVARDVVSRAIAAQFAAGQKVFLDCRGVENFTMRFPAITAHCVANGLNPAADKLPVRPAAHYHMGGIAVDDRGRSNVTGLYAVGECAATGLHGANRLASNSLLEAAVMAKRVAETVAEAGLSKTHDFAPQSPAVVSDAHALDIRRIMTHYVGVIRTAEGLRIAEELLQPLATSAMGQVALAITQAARTRTESIGAHYLAGNTHTKFLEDMDARTPRTATL